MDTITIKTSRFYAFCYFNLLKFLFPDRMTISQSGVITVKRKSLIFFRLNEKEQIPFARIASVRHLRGMLWDSVILESSGGSNTVDLSGLSKRSAINLTEKINTTISLK